MQESAKQTKENNLIIRYIFLALFIVWGLIVLVIFNRSRGLPYLNFPEQLGFILVSFNLSGDLFSYYLEVFKGFVTVLFLYGFSYLAGRLVMSKLKFRFENWSEKAGLTTGLGLVISNYLIFMMGILGLISKVVFVIIFGLIFSVLIYLNFQNKPLRKDIPNPNHRDQKLKFLDYILIIMLGFLGLIYLLGTLSPEVFYDSLVYHLGAANQYVQHGGIIYFENELHSNMPIALTQFYTFILLFSNELGAKLFHSLTGVLLFISVLGFCKRFFIKRVGLMAGVLLVSVPLLAKNSWTAAADMGLTYFTFLLFYVVVLMQFKQEFTKKLLVLAGIFAGFIICIKYTASFSVISAVALMVFYNVKYRKKVGVKNILMFSGLVFAVFLPWLVKNWVLTGDPLFPYLTAYLNNDHGFLNFIKVTREYFTDVQSFLIHPWFLTMGGDSGSNFIGPVFLMFLPFILFLKTPNKKIKGLKVFSLSFWVLGILSTKMLRFFAPVYPMLSILVAAGILYQVKQRIFRRLLYIVFFLGVLINLFWVFNFSYHSEGWRVLTGELSKREFLLAEHSGYHSPYYSGAEFINNHTEPDSTLLLLGEARSYYIDRKVILNSVFDKNPIVQWTRVSEHPEGLLNLFKKNEVDYVMYNLKEMLRLQKYYQIFKWTDREQELYKQFAESYLEPVFQKDYIVIYRVKIPE